MGQLGWVCTVARPDIAFAVGRLQRVCSLTPTTNMRTAIKRLFAYLHSSIDFGPFYSAGNHKLWNSNLSECLSKAGFEVEKQHTITHTDASFADNADIKSTSGCVIYFKSV